jgi:NAD(P)H-dependent FMN reductase
MIWSSPTYHGSVSGSFKNALDWLILLAEAGRGRGAAQADRR